MASVIIDIAYSILVAVLTLLVFLIVGKFVEMLAVRVLQELQLDYIFEKIGIEFSGSKVIAKIIAFVFYFWGAIVALKQLGLERIAIVIASVFAGILLALSLALGFTDAVHNLMLGIYLRKKYLKRKDLAVGNVKGKIINVGWTKLKIMTKEKDVLAVPYNTLR